MAGESSAYPNLFSELQVGRKTLRNRIALPATLTNYGVANRITERWTNFLVERARGGAGLIVSEVIAVDPNAIAQGAIVTGFDDANADGFRRTADGVRAAGGCLVAQLWHPGRQQLWHPTISPMGVSDQPDAYSWTVPHVMTEAEIGNVVEAYVSVAARLQSYGLDGVELHGAHGYLITQFLSPWSNTRDDGYGGSLENRARFVREIADGIRKACGADFIVGLKMPAQEGVAGGIDVEEAAHITAHLAPLGLLDYFAYAQGNFSLSLEDHVPDINYRPGHFIDLHKRLRPVADGVPVMALGRIGTPGLAEKVVAEGYGDLVGMTRAQIADAAFANKARAGRAAEIRPSVFDNYCWGEVHAGKPLREFHNPHLAEAGEADWTPPPADGPRNVVVVGAGPGGLEAAWVAAARGHRVTVLGPSDEVGGRLRFEAALPGRADMAKVYRHQKQLAERHQVAFRLGKRVTSDDVRDLQPDAVVIATGSDLRFPATLSPDSAPVVSARDYVSGQHGGGTALLFDQDHSAATYATADLLARDFDRVILMSPRPQLAQRVNYCSAIGVHRRLYSNGVQQILAAEPLEFKDKTVRYVNVFTRREDSIGGVDLLVYATPRIVEEPLSAALAGLEVHLVGDCQSPRDLMAAIHGGHAVGLRL